MLLYPALLSLGAGALASCAGEKPPPPPQISAIRPLPPPQERSAPPPTALRPAHKPDPPASAEAPASATAGEVLAMTAPKPAGSGPAPEPASPPPDAEAISTSLGPAGSLPPKTSELIGMDQPAATRLFGAAAERSEEPPATIWRYKNVTCELDLFFYLDLRSGRMRTLHYALKGDGADAARGQDCLRSLLAARGN